MLTRTAHALTIPASITLLCCLNATPPRWLTPPALRKPVVVEAPKPMVVPEPLEAPKILAVDRRIARRINALRPAVKQRLVRVLKKLPKKVTLLVTSATRTREEQASLRPTFGIKARPGTSTHEDGRALDVNVLVDGVRVSPRSHHKIIGKAMASEGFKHLGPRDPVHYSIPKTDIDLSLLQGPDLQVLTVSEMEALEEEHAAAVAAAEAANANLPAASAPVSATQSAISLLPPGL